MPTKLRLALFSLQALIATILAWVLNLTPLRWILRRHPVPGDRSVSAAWLTGVLRKSGALDASNEVVALEFVDLSGGRGFAGAMTRLVPTYRKPSDRAPRALILKMNPSSYTYRKRTIVGGHVRESILYSEAAKLVPPKLPPTSYWSYGSHLLGEYAFLLEDLDEIKAESVAMVFGNQIWGVKVPPSPGMEPVALIRKIFLSTAEMHAAHWRSPALKQMHWLKAVDWYQGRGRDRWEIAIDFARNCWHKILAQRDAPGAPPPAWTLSPKLREIVTLSFRNASWAKLQAHLSDPSVPFTLTHGDLHANNMRFLPGTKDVVASGRVILFDWSEVGPWEPTADLGQMLISDVKPDIFRQHSRDLVRAYYDRLLELGVREAGYTFEHCWSAFCRGGVEKWVWMFAVMSVRI